MGSIWRRAFGWRASDPKWSKVSPCLNQPQTELLGLLCIWATIDMGLLSALDYFRHGATFYLGLLSTWGYFRHGATFYLGLLSTWGYFRYRATFDGATFGWDYFLWGYFWSGLLLLGLLLVGLLLMGLLLWGYFRGDSQKYNITKFTCLLNGSIMTHHIRQLYY